MLDELLILKKIKEGDIKAFEELFRRYYFPLCCYAAGMFVERRTRNVRMIPQKVVYTISYKPWQGTYYIHHIRGDLHFKVKRAKMLFGSRDLHIWFEMITCKVDTEQVVVFPRTDRLPTRTIFSDTNFKYDENFWKDFNVIPLEEEISKLIEKISLKIEEIGD